MQTTAMPKKLLVQLRYLVLPYKLKVICPEMKGDHEIEGNDIRLEKKI
jgi:hypothetical protein